MIPELSVEIAPCTKFGLALRLILIALLVPLTIGGCATLTYSPFPKSEKPITIAVSGSTVSTFSEVPANDYLIPESQVFYRYFALFGRPPITILLGINRVISRSQLGTELPALAIKFSPTIEQHVSSVLSDQTEPRRFVLTNESENPDLVILPYATLTDSGNGIAGLVLEIAVRVREARNRPLQTRWYFYESAERRPLAGTGEGWSDREAHNLKQAAHQGLTRLVDAVLRDLSGRYPSTLPPADAKFVNWQLVSFGDDVSAAILEDYSDFLVVAVVQPSILNDRFIGIVERRLLVDVPGIKISP